MAPTRLLVVEVVVDDDIAATIDGVRPGAALGLLHTRVLLLGREAACLHALLHVRDDGLPGAALDLSYEGVIVGVLGVLRVLWLFVVGCRWRSSRPPVATLLVSEGKLPASSSCCRASMRWSQFHAGEVTLRRERAPTVGRLRRPCPTLMGGRRSPMRSRAAQRGRGSVVGRGIDRPHFGGW
jgi:hypothetical protein